MPIRRTGPDRHRANAATLDGLRSTCTDPLLQARRRGGDNSWHYSVLRREQTCRPCHEARPRRSSTGCLLACSRCAMQRASLARCLCLWRLSAKRNCTMQRGCIPPPCASYDARHTLRAPTAHNTVGASRRGGGRRSKGRPSSSHLSVELLRHLDACSVPVLRANIHPYGRPLPPPLRSAAQVLAVSNSPSPFPPLQRKCLQPASQPVQALSRRWDGQADGQLLAGLPSRGEWANHAPGGNARACSGETPGAARAPRRLCWPKTLPLSSARGGRRITSQRRAKGPPGCMCNRGGMPLR